MSARKRVEALLRSRNPNWNLVPEKDINSCIRSKIERFRGLHHFSAQTRAARESKAIVIDIEKLYALLARKLVVNVDRVDKKIRDLEGKEKDQATASPFDLIYLRALKSVRARLAVPTPAAPPPTPPRRSRVVKSGKPAEKVSCTMEKNLKELRSLSTATKSGSRGMSGCNYIGKIPA